MLVYYTKQDHNRKLLMNYQKQGDLRIKYAA